MSLDYRAHEPFRDFGTNANYRTSFEEVGNTVEKVRFPVRMTDNIFDALNAMLYLRDTVSYHEDCPQC